MTNWNAVIPILMHLFIFFCWKMYYLHKATSAVSCVKPNAGHEKRRYNYDDVGFPKVYRRIYRRKFLTLSDETSRYICKCIRMSIQRQGQRRIDVASTLCGCWVLLTLVVNFDIATDNYFSHCSVKDCFVYRTCGLCPCCVAVVTSCSQATL